MAHVNLPAAQPIYDAAARFVDAALRGNDSIFTPGSPIWTAANVEDLYHRFVERPDTSNRGFLEKFQDQLAGTTPGATPLAPAAPEVYQLAGELIYVHLLIAAGNIGGQAKRQLINTVLGWSPTPVNIPPERAAALDLGLARVGTAYLTYRPFQLAFLLRFVRDWKRLPSAEHDRLLSDPWAFKTMLFQIEISHAYAQREALLHLVHPNTFEAIVSREHKQRFVGQFKDFVHEMTDDVDRALLQIRTQVDRRYGPGRSLYTIAEPPPPIDSRLPRSLGARLGSYVSLVARLDGSHYTPAQILEKFDTSSQADDLRALPAPEELVADLLKLRLIKLIEPSGNYRRWSHLDDGSEPLMLRYAALTLLVEDGIGGYELPSVRAPMDGSPHSQRDWPIGRDLIDWYVEAGLVEPAGDGQWQAKQDALAPRSESTATARAINTFLEHLRRVQASQSDLPPLSDDVLSVRRPPHHPQWTARHRKNSPRTHSATHSLA
jgi:hypothetical protein